MIYLESKTGEKLTYQDKLGRVVGLLSTTYTWASMKISKNVEHTN